MSAPMKNHARIRLYFDNAPVEPSWMFVDQTKTKTISSIEDKIRENYSEQFEDLELTLLGCKLPPWESSCLLHDEDTVHVRAVDTSSTRLTTKECVKLKKKDKNISIDDEEITEGEKKKHKKKKKHKDKSDCKTDSDIPTEENNEIKPKHKKKHKDKNQIKHDTEEEASTKTKESPLDGEKSKKESKKQKRKQDDSEISDSIAEKRPKSEKEGKEISANFLSLEVEKKLEKEETKNSGDKSNNAIDTSLLDNSCSPDGKKKRKRKRSRKRKNNSNLELTLAKEQLINLADNLLQTSRNENFKSPSNENMFSWKQRGKRITPSNNYKKFESDEENETENSMSASTFVYSESDTSQTKIEETHSIQNERRYSHDYDTKSVNSSILESVNTVFTMEMGDNISPTHEQEIPRETGSLQCTASTLANGVTVYSRPRNRKERRFQTREFSKEEQLNTNLTNRSFIFKNEDCKTQTEDTNGNIEPDNPDTGDINTCINDTDCVIVPLFKDYSRFSLLTGVPRQGDTIAYKVIEMSDMYTPEISEYKEAEVCNFDTESQMIELKIKHQQKGKKEKGKFDVTLEDEESIITTEQESLDKVCLSWSSLMETRLLTQ